jgi:hypothetical protein
MSIDLFMRGVVSGLFRNIQEINHIPLNLANMEDKILYIRILGNNVNSFYEKRIKEGSKFLYLLWQKEGDRKGQKVKR